MKLSEEEKERLTEEKFRTFRNVNRLPFVYGLPWNMALAFFIPALILFLVAILMAFLAGTWLLSLVVIIAIGVVYFLLTGIIEKNGVFYLSLLIGYYGSNLFTGIRINKKLRVFSRLTNSEDGSKH